MIDIYITNEKGAAEVFATVQPTDESYHLRELQGKDECEIKLMLAEYIDFPLGCYITWKGARYTLCAPAQIEKNGVRKLSYTLTFSGALKSLAKYRMRHIVSRVLQDSRLDFSITAYPHEILQMIVDNINYRESGWTVGRCEPVATVTQTYSMTTVEQALANLATECGTEYEIDGKTIHLRKVEYNKSNPIALQYGKGGGFIPGVARKNSSDTNPMEVLFVQGGEKNIDSSKYGCSTLLLPSNSGMVTYFDGENFRFVNKDGTSTEDDAFNEGNARAYKVSADRMSIERADKDKASFSEGAMTETDVYPKRVGTVTAVINENGNAKTVLFQDSGIPETLNYKELTAAGCSLNVVFNSGMLTGKTFEVNYNHSKRQFALIGTTIDDVPMPDETWRPAIGDEFVILNMVMPSDYLSNDTLHTGAEYDLLRAAVKYMYENEDDKYTFEGTLDTIWSKQNWATVGGMIKPGGYVKFRDPQFEADGVSLRITSVKESINNPYAPTIEISNSQKASSVASKIANIEATTPVAIETARREAENFANRGFAAVKETTDMLEAQFDGYTERITPVAVQTMQTIVGDESLQYAFYASATGVDEIAPAVNYDSGTRAVTISYYGTDTIPYYLRHKTLGVTTMSTADYGGNELKQWAVYSFTSGALDDSKAYYVYIKAPEDTTEPVSFVLSETARAMDAEAGCYLLLFGFINTPGTGGDRSFAQMYGYSEILPGRITTDKIISQDGKTGFDLVNGRIFGNIDFSASDDTTTLINNIINNNATVKSGAAAAGVANTANNTANTAKATADAALAATQDDTHNWLLDTDRERTVNTYRDNAAVTWDLVSGAAGTVFPEDDKRSAWLSYYVDGWTEDYPPFPGGWNMGCWSNKTSGWDWYNGNSQTDSGYIQITASTRRYWHKGDAKGRRLLRFWLYADGDHDPNPRPKVYNAMLSFGMALADYTSVPVSLEYLREALAEAASSETSVAGGLVLSKYIGVRDSGGVIVAGMSGTDNASAGTMPMIWAGAKANTADGQRNASFRVYSGGHVDMSDVSISQKSSTGEIQIDGGSITFNANNGKLTQIMSKTMGGISTAINDAGGAVLKYGGIKGSVSCSVSDGAVAVEVVKTKNDTPYKLAKVTTVGTTSQNVVIKLFTAKHNGTFTLGLDVEAVSNLKATRAYSIKTAYVWNENSIGGRTLNGVGDFSYDGIASCSYNLIGVYTDEACTQRVSPSGGKYAQTRGATYYVKVNLEAKAKLIASSNVYQTLTNGNKIRVAYWSTYGSLIGTATADMTATVVSTSSEFRSTYYSDGIYLQTKANQYIGLSPSSSPAIQARSGNAIMKFTDNGLLQSLNGASTFYRVNPLVLICQVTRSPTKSYTHDDFYNPLDKTVYVTRQGVGIFSIRHNLSNGNHTLIGTATSFEGQYVMYVTPYSTGSDEDVVYVSDDATRNDPKVMTLHFFDYKSY